MKKIYTITLGALLALGMNAQNVVKFKTPNNFSKNKFAASKGQLSPLDVSDSYVTCNSRYIAGTTMLLSFQLVFVPGPDDAYADSLAITFPTGITPISSPTDTLPSFNASNAETLNPIAGQTVSWGKNTNDSLGGIAFDAEFSILVSVAGNVSGDQVATFHLSDDGYDTPVDAAGNVLIQQATNKNFAMFDGFTPSGCNGSSEFVYCAFANYGLDSVKTINLSYSIDGGAAVTELVTVNMGYEDSADYFFNMDADLSVAKTYTIKVWSTLAGDTDMTNDTLSYTVETFAPLTITTTPIINSFEAQTDLDAWSIEDTDNSGFTWDVSNNAKTGTTSLRAYEDDADGASEDWLFSRCLDLQAGKLYSLAYWKRLTTGYAGSLAAMLGTNQNSTVMNQVLVPAATLPANSTYIKDSVSFSVTTTGVYYIGFRAVNVDANNSIALRIDDVKLSLLGTVGINEVESAVSSIYPNPSNGLINISVVKPNTQLEVFNILGEKVYSQANLTVGVNTVDLSTTLSAGTYAVRLINNNEIQVKNIVVNK